MPNLTDPLLPYLGRRVLLGVSGGADSVALLRAMHEVGAQVSVAHLDHALRPESAAEAVWVADLAASLGLPWVLERVEVAQVALRRGWNLEEAARRVRYDFLTRAAKRGRADVVLTAHTRRDQAETVLMQLLRGEAVLHGMPHQRGRVVRPWLAVSRPDIEAYLNRLGQPWLEDASNTDARYTRAWLRQEVMPLLSARYPGLEAALLRLARLQAQDDAHLHALAGRLQPHTPLHAQSPAVLRRWVKGQLKKAGQTFHAEHLEAIAAALQAGGTHHLTLPAGRHITVTDHRLATEGAEFTTPDFPLPPGWTLRQRRAGDRIRLPGGTRKLSDLFTDRHVPRDSRDSVPLLVCDGGVQWVGLNPPLWAAGAREQAAQPPDPLHEAMGEALKLARQAAHEQEVPVGAVVLSGAGQVVGRGRNTSRQQSDLTAHAELGALREAARTLGTPYLKDCTLVVTLEPCPMCLGAAIEAQVGHVVYGASNPKAGALGGVTDLLASPWNHRPLVTGGVRAREAARLLKASFRAIRAGKEGPEAEA